MTNNFCKVAGHSSNLYKYITFLYTNIKYAEKEVMDNPANNSLKGNKVSRDKFYLKDKGPLQWILKIFEERHKDMRKLKIHTFSLIELILQKWPFYQKPLTGSV